MSILKGVYHREARIQTHAHQHNAGGADSLIEADSRAGWGKTGRWLLPTAGDHIPYISRTSNTMVLICVIPRMVYTPPRRPMPLFFPLYPPNGV